MSKQSSPLRGPPAENGMASVLTGSVVPGQGVSTNRLANLDCQNKLVKRGRKVSYQGLRGLVARVSRGRCLVGYIDAFERFTGRTEWVICERLQVVV